MPRPPLLNLLRPPPGDGVPDRDLARRYAETGDEAAFELLVRRHADAVWAACRRILPDHHAAEDAFQAAFLALARRAGTIRTPCAAGWLYRVAVRAALRARAAPARSSGSGPHRRRTRTGLRRPRWSSRRSPGWGRSIGCRSSCAAWGG